MMSALHDVLDRMGQPAIGIVNDRVLPLQYSALIREMEGDYNAGELVAYLGSLEPRSDVRLSKVIEVDAFDGLKITIKPVGKLL